MSLPLDLPSHLGYHRAQFEFPVLQMEVTPCSLPVGIQRDGAPSTVPGSGAYIHISAMVLSNISKAGEKVLGLLYCSSSHAPPAPHPPIKNNSLLFSCPVLSDSAILWTVACRAPLSVEFSRQGYWVAISFSNDSVDTLEIILNFVHTMLTSLFH